MQHTSDLVPASDSPRNGIMSRLLRLYFFVFLSLSLVVSSVPLSKEISSSDYTTKDAINKSRTRKITIGALVCSSLSTLASLVAFYWFCRMEKQFRHRLIVILIYGDLVRASCYFIAATVMLVFGTVPTDSAFCQASGFFILYGTETSDFAVLVIAIHTAVQVFRPSGQQPSDGLYPYRRYIYAGALLFPTTMAGMAFVNSRGGYLLQGAFCTLPIRPFWYRLALAWIPRYMIVLVIISVAIAIYMYVGWEFRSYNAMSKKYGLNMTSDITGTTVNDDSQQTRGSLIGKHYAAGKEAGTPPGSGIPQKQLDQHVWHASSPSQDVDYNESCGTSSSARIRATSISPTAQSFPTGTRRLHSKHRGTGRAPLVSILSSHTTRSSDSTDNVHIPPSRPTTSDVADSMSTTSIAPALPPVEGVSSSSRVSTLLEPNSPGHNRMIRQRARIHRQLRLMFIYPVVYTLMWLVPFINHCTMYSDFLANHPIWGLRLGNTICIASMGFVDCLVFSLREKPWRAIATSDGTLLGSFFVWNTSEERRMGRPGGRSSSTRAGEAAPHKQANGEGLGSRSNMGSSTSLNGHSRFAKDWARERLEWEREERYKVLREMATRGPGASGPSTRRNSLSESGCSEYEGEDRAQEEDARQEENRRVEGVEGRGLDL